MSTKTEPGPFDGMARAEPDEPVFTLRAHDPLASILVHEWVDRRRKAIREAFAREEITEAKRTLELIQCSEAEELAWSMAAWRRGELEKAAEAVAAELTTEERLARLEEIAAMSERLNIHDNKELIDIISTAIDDSMDMEEIVWSSTAGAKYILAAFEREGIRLDARRAGGEHEVGGDQGRAD